MVGAALLVAILVAGCDGTSAKEREAAERLATIKNALELATSPDDLERGVADAFALCTEMPGTTAADQAYETAEASVLDATWSMDAEELFDDGLPEVGAGYSFDFGEDTWAAAAVTGFAMSAPEAYRDRAFGVARSMFATMAAEWTRRSLDVANDRVSWAKDLGRTGWAGSFDNFSDSNVYEISYQRRVLALVPGSEPLRSAYARIAGTVAYAIKSVPHTSDIDVDSDSITSYYTAAEVKRAETNSRSLLSRARAAQQAVEKAAQETTNE